VYTINENSLLEIQIVGRLHGQRIRNVFHYLYPSGEIDLSDGKTAAENALDDFQIQVVTPLLTLISDEYTIERLSAQWVYPDRYRAILEEEDQPGGVDGSSLPSYCAVVVSKFSDASGPQYQARNYFAGIPVADEDDSGLSPAALTNWQTFGDNLLIPLGLGLPDIVVYPTAATPESAQPANVTARLTGTSVVRTLRAQRRRELGVGE